MRFEVVLLGSVLCAGAVSAAEKPLFSPTGYFSESCLAEFPREEYTADVTSALNDARNFLPERAALLTELKQAASPRYAAVAKRAEIQDALIAYMEKRLAADTPESLLFAWSAFQELRHFTNYFRGERQLLKERQSAPAQKTFSVRDFGAKGDGKNDDGPAIRQAIEAALNAKVSTRVFLPAGTYRIVPETIYPENLTWKNRLIGKWSTWARDILKKAHLRLTMPEHLVLEGEQGKTKLMFTDPTLCGIRILGGYDTTIRNLSLDYERLPFTQGRIVAVNPNKTMLEVEIDDGFSGPDMPNFLQAPSRRITPVSPLGRTYCKTTFPLGKEVEALGRNRYRLQVGSFRADAPRTDLEVGNLAVIIGRYDTDRSQAISSVCSRFDVLDHVVVHSAPSQAFLLHSEAPILQSCRVEPPEGSMRLATSNGDGFMFSSDGRVGPYLEGCVFSSMEDDGINLTASSTAFDSIGADGLRSQPDRTMGYNSPGVMIVDGITGQVKAVRKVQATNGVPQFVPALPSGIVTRDTLKMQRLTVDQQREQRTWYQKGYAPRPDMAITLGETFGGSAIINCTFRNIRGLGVQVTAPDVWVENSTFDTMTGSGISMTALCAWSMYHCTRNSVVRNCTIRNTGGSGIGVGYIPPYSDGKMEARPIHDLRIENNVIESSRNSAIWLANSSDVYISGNRITVTDAKVPAIVLSNTFDVTAANNVFRVPAGARVFRFVDQSAEAHLTESNNKEIVHE